MKGKIAARDAAGTKINVFREWFELTLPLLEAGTPLIKYLREVSLKQLTSFLLYCILLVAKWRCLNNMMTLKEMVQANEERNYYAFILDLRDCKTEQEVDKYMDFLALELQPLVTPRRWNSYITIADDRRREILGLPSLKEQRLEEALKRIPVVDKLPADWDCLEDDDTWGGWIDE